MKINNSSGFSILMAIGTIGLLLIIVTSLAMSYMRESKLSRFSYDEVLASTAAEGEFEYAMLKVRNHRDGFQDTVNSTEPDGNLLALSTPRSAGLKTEYDIVAASTGTVFSLSGAEHLIIPLFASDEGTIVSGGTSRNPGYHTGATNVSNLTISGINDLSWTIVAMSGSESVAITGTGGISSLTEGVIRTKTSQCYDKDTGRIKICSSLSVGDEEIVYSYDTTKKISDFLSTTTDPYFILYNSNHSAISVDMRSGTPFSLPTISLTATAKKGNSSQVFHFVEDKSRYYDALKYGIYNTP